jgi:hypothetical protein
MTTILKDKNQEMGFMKQFKKNRVSGQRGASMVEYMPILTLFILISVPSMKFLGNGIQQKFCSADTMFEGKNLSQTPSPSALLELDPIGCPTDIVLSGYS